jgi:polyisoprenoid-binding protein YceI
MKTPVLLLLLALTLSVQAAPLMLKIVPGRSHNNIEFRSEAATETVIGKTHQVTGFVELDPASDTIPARGEIRVDLASLKTGIDLRDRHMRENHLETNRYPEAVFTLTSLALASGALAEGVRTAVQLKGTLKLHGVEHEITPETFLTYTGGSSPSLHIESRFTVKLPDYNIKRPQFLVLRLAEEQKIEVNLVAE